MKRPSGKGRTYTRDTPGFDAAVLGTSFNGTDPGLRPDLLVQANTLDDVVSAVQEAGRRHWPISICSGGHSWMQNHLREGGLLLDMSRINQVDIDPDQQIARVGPGCWSVDLDRALRKHRLFFPVAHAIDVCMGGFLLQGGFGWNSRMLGLACESVVGIDLVTADGALIHASEHQHADLYWAARGAGPGFFAVVVRYHLRVYPRPRITALGLQVFRMEHLDDVFLWAEKVGPEVARSVEFQMLLTRKATGIFAPGIEVITPVLANSWAEARAATAFLRQSPLRSKASFTTPLFPISTGLMSTLAAKRIFPPKMRWSVDNLWSNAPMSDMLPGLRRIAETLPPMPSHVLMISWHPPAERPDMAFSVEGKHYLALYGEWKNPADDALYQNWATDQIGSMADLGVGIQLADENLARRSARFMSDANLQRLQQIRAQHDPQGLFPVWRNLR